LINISVTWGVTTGSTAHGTDGAARFHNGPDGAPARGAPGTTWHRSSLAMVGEDEGDETRPEVGSLEHKRRHNDDSLSSLREQRRARKRAPEIGGKVRDALEVVLAFYRVSGSDGERWSGQ
jgi:hypothetical protein